jgi:hypothetical protein
MSPRLAAAPSSTEAQRRAMADQEMRFYLSGLLARVLRQRQWGWASWIRRVAVDDERRREAVRNLATTIYRDLAYLLEESLRCGECGELEGNRIHAERQRAGFHVFREVPA